MTHRLDQRVDVCMRALLSVLLEPSLDTHVREQQILVCTPCCARDQLHHKEVARLQLQQQLRRVSRLVKDLRKDGGGGHSSASHPAEDPCEQGNSDNPLYSNGGAQEADPSTVSTAMGA